jgi:hypothetical protein
MQDIEAIIKDLYTLDPELASHDTEVRSLVAGLIAQHPHPVPDQVFAEKLRRKLLMAAPAPALTWQTVFWHLLPVGAVAILVFMLVPSYTSTVPYSVVVPTAVPETVSTPPQASEEGLEPTPVAKVSADTTPATFSTTPQGEAMDTAVVMETSAEAVPESDVALMRSMAAPDVEMYDPIVKDSIFVIEPVVADAVTFEYQWLQTDGFVAIMRLPERDIVGVSELLVANATGTVTITDLTLTPGGLYAAVLYQDTNTDGVFDLAVDHFAPNSVADSWTEFVEEQFLVSE